MYRSPESLLVCPLPHSPCSLQPSLWPSTLHVFLPPPGRRLHPQSRRLVAGPSFLAVQQTHPLHLVPSSPSLPTHPYLLLRRLCAFSPPNLQSQLPLTLLRHRCWLFIHTSATRRTTENDLDSAESFHNDCMRPRLCLVAGQRFRSCPTSR